ncbi:MAG: serine hydrolase [Solirubrobacterales bacterium]
MSRRARVVLGAAVLIAAASAGGRSVADQVEKGRHGDSLRQGWPRIDYPAPRAIRSAQEFAASRGDVSFAVMNDSIGLRGYDTERRFSSASVSKALLLAAELRRLDSEHLPLDGETKNLLEPMIVYSDNRAADAVYAEVGDEGLEEVARQAGMRNFEATPGFWGGDRITAADMARFFYRLDQNLPGRNLAYAKGLLARIAPVERWGIPQAVGHGWSVWFKGGWRPSGQKDTSGAVTHQAALLVHRRGERVGLAVLSDEPPGDGGGFAAIEGVTERLLAKPPPRRKGWPSL